MSEENPTVHVDGRIAERVRELQALADELAEQTPGEPRGAVFAYAMTCVLASRLALLELRVEAMAERGAWEAPLKGGGCEG